MTIRLRIIFLISIFAICELWSHGQSLLQPSEVIGEPLGVKQGLSQGMINCVYQDKEGYIWICTKDGLNRYDGYHIVTFRNNPNNPYSLPENYCNTTLEDDKGNFWLGTNTKGLFLFDKVTEKFYPVPAINNHKENFCITDLQFSKGRLFVNAWNNILMLEISEVNVTQNAASAAKAKLILNYNQAQPNKLYRIDGKINPLYYGIGWMPDHSLWISFTDSIFCLAPNADASKWQLSSYSRAAAGIGATHGSVSFFPIPGEPENIAIANNNNIQIINTKTKKSIFNINLPEASTKNMNKYYRLNDGNFCRFTDTLVYIHHPAKREIEIIPVNFYDKLSTGAFINLFTDVNGVQWFGTNGFGIVKRDPRKKLFRSYKSVHLKDVFWSQPYAYLTALSQPTTKRFRLTGTPSDKNGELGDYLGTTDNSPAMYLYRNNTLMNTDRLYPDLYKEFISSIKVYNDPKNRLWIYYQDQSKKNHIGRLDKRTGTILTKYNIPDDIESPEPFVSEFYLDKGETLWITTINGLYSFQENNNTWKHWKNIPGNNNSLSANQLLGICPDPSMPEKYIWIGTEGSGFNRFEKSTGNCIRYDEKDGLPNNVAYCILSDSLKNLWISTNKGLSCFDPIQKTFRNFTDDDGLPGNEFNRNDAMRLPNGELMFGGVDGVVTFNPIEILQKQPPAPIVFTGVSISNKSINWKTDSSNLNAPIGYAKLLTLQPGQNIFSISFATLEYRSNAKKMYKYKLEGFDKDWTIPDAKNEVTYTNLSPGTYTFYIMGANTDGVWNEKPISLEIIVRPYWHQTIWFKIAMVLLFAAALYALYRYRLSQVLQLQKLRNRIARDLHDEIGSTLSSISIYAASANKINTGNPKVANILSRINTGTSEMMEAMSDIIWAVNTGSGNLDDLANRLRSFAVHVTEAKNMELHFTDNEYIPSIELDMEQRKNVYLICKEAISNAVKYSNGTQLGVEVSVKNHKLVMQISDNGIGFRAEDQSPSVSSQSFGKNGLKNMKSRAEEINAQLEITSEPGSGTQVMLTMPTKNHNN